MINKKKNIDVFNIYYINFSKVYEISMMINNVIVSSIQREKSSTSEKSGSVNASITTALKNLENIKGVLGIQIAEKKTNSSKMIESLDVQTTKSILLKQLDTRSKLINDFSNCNEGDLVKLNNVKLNILNEDNLREFKLFRSDALKGYQVDGIDVNNFITSMLKDYSYLIYGVSTNTDEQIVIKIPMELENEFESKYNIDDLLIGNVSVIGVYKGNVAEESINTNTINYLQELGSKKNLTEEIILDSKIFTSSHTEDPYPYEKKTKSTRQFRFIDVIAVVQNVKFRDDFEMESVIIPWYKKLINFLKRERN